MKMVLCGGSYDGVVLKWKGCTTVLYGGEIYEAECTGASPVRMRFVKRAAE